MKKWLLITFTVIYSILYGQTVSSTCNASDSIKNYFKEDACKLAVKRVINTNSPYKDSIAIHNPTYLNYLNAFIAIHNSGLPAKDTVEKLKIHSNLGFVFNNVLFTSDSVLIYMQNFKNNVFPTGDITLDSLMTKHHLQKVQYNKMSTYDIVLLKSDTAFNAIALSKFMDVNLPWIYTVGPNYLFGDDSQITDSINPNYTELTYSYGWGDCMAGCISRRFWKFRVFNDCSVEYIGSYGSQISSEFFTVGIKENISAFEKMTIYPNPVQDKLNLKFETNEILQIEIFNGFGNKVRVIEDFSPKNEIDLKDLQDGTYYLKVEGHFHKRVFKFIKE